MAGDIVLKHITEALGVVDGEFEAELSIHILSSLDVLYQNGVKQLTTPFDINNGTWDDLLRENSEETNARGKALVVQYVLLRTKILFDPPPPSSVNYFTSAVEETLWRIRQVYDTDNLERLNEVIFYEDEV